MNQFEQFCINYGNEKMQSFCTHRLIHKEQDWYKAEGFNLPEIPFPGNSGVLGKTFHAIEMNLFVFDVCNERKCLNFI